MAAVPAQVTYRPRGDGPPCLSHISHRLLIRHRIRLYLLDRRWTLICLHGRLWIYWTFGTRLRIRRRPLRLPPWANWLGAAQTLSATCAGETLSLTGRRAIPPPHSELTSAANRMSWISANVTWAHFAGHCQQAECGSSRDIRRARGRCGRGPVAGHQRARVLADVSRPAAPVSLGHGCIPHNRSR
jgi:hypothetical protein